MLKMKKRLNVYSVGAVVGVSRAHRVLTCLEFFEDEDLGDEAIFTGIDQTMWVPNSVVSTMTFVGPKYVVMDEHTLGYLVDGVANSMDVLAGSVIKGGHDWKNGAVSIVPGHTKIRPATPEDFEAYRVMLPPDYQRAASTPTNSVNPLSAEQVTLWAKEADPGFGNRDDDMADAIVGLGAIARLVTLAYAAGQASVQPSEITQ